MKHDIKAVGFDFDGTLIVSEETKAQEIAKIFKEQFNLTRGVIRAYKQLSKHSLNRTQKIEALFLKLLQRKPTTLEQQKIARDFGQRYEQNLRTCPLFQCTNIIQELKKQVDFLFLLSLEDVKEVKRIAKHCGLARYFDEILGGPTNKVENLKHIVQKHRLKPQEIVYIADAASDIIASKKVNVKVVLIQKRFSYKKLRESLEADFVFSSLCELPATIEKYA